VVVINENKHVKEDVINKEEELRTIVDAIKIKVKPTVKELENALTLFNEVKRIIESSLNLEYKFKVELEGSLAKGTCLKDEIDLDVFILVKYAGINNDWIRSKIINPLTNILSKHYVIQLRYATHPYIHLVHNNIEVDIVPAYWADNVNEIRTPVDRTPFHTRYVLSKLNENQKDEVRVLKKFFKSLGIYGAELKVEGFSGYLCELLIIKYGDFINTLKAVSKWRIPQVVTMDDIPEHEKKILIKSFKDSALIFPDPIDPSRNAAAAVSRRSLSLAIVASSYFLRKPSEEFFFPKYQVTNLEDLNREIMESERCISFIILNIDRNVVPDILWGILKKILRKGLNILSQYDFKVYDARIWSDEKELAVLFYEAESCRLSKFKLHEGPPPEAKEDLNRFINKYVRDYGVFGPWIGYDGKLLVLRRRRYVSIDEILRKEVAGNLPENISLSDVIVGDLRKLPDKLLSNKDFIYWLIEAILKVPPWMAIERKG